MLVEKRYEFGDDIKAVQHMQTSAAANKIIHLCGDEKHKLRFPSSFIYKSTVDIQHLLFGT